MSNCPVCGHNGLYLNSFSPEFLCEQLRCYFNEIVSLRLDIESYNILRCPNCSLEYADPMKAGMPEFYDWIGNRPGYYSDYRWEYEAVITELKGKNKGKLLDIGCGSGFFLEKVHRDTNFEGVGLDLNRKAVDECKNKNIEAYSDTLDTFVSNSLRNERQFDYVVSFHCLEHVESPLDFVRLMVKLVKPKGKIYLSTPYSPMSFEYSWFDIQNHPPHHLTRWNVLSYSELARQVNMEARFFMPKASPVWRRVLSTIQLIHKGPHLTCGFKDQIFLVAKHPWHTVKEIYHQTKRETFNGQAAADIILAELSMKQICIENDKKGFRQFHKRQRQPVSY